MGSGDDRRTAMSVSQVPSAAGDGDLKFHISSLKFKVFVIETWLKTNIELSIRHTFGYNCEEMSRVHDSESAIAARVTFGFNAEELERVIDAQAYDRPTRTGHYPLVEWGWDRDRCLEYIKSILGVDWDKSACPYCPFTLMTATAIERQKRFPKETAHAMFLERVSLAMNPRGQLYKKLPLYQIVEDSGNSAALAEFEELMRQHRWALYRVRRIYQAKPIYEVAGKRKQLVGHDPQRKGTVRRCVEKIEEFATAAEANQRIKQVSEERRIPLRESHRLTTVPIAECGVTYPTREEFFVCAPAVVDTKARYGIEHFDSKWQGLADMYCGRHDLPLFDGILSDDHLIQIG